MKWLILSVLLAWSAVAGWLSRPGAPNADRYDFAFIPAYTSLATFLTWNASHCLETHHSPLARLFVPLAVLFVATALIDVIENLVKLDVLRGGFWTTMRGLAGIVKWTPVVVTPLYLIIAVLTCARRPS